MRFLWPVTLLVFVVPVYAVAVPIQVVVQSSRIAASMGVPSDPLTADELGAALARRRCGIRMSKDLLLGIFHFDEPTVAYPYAWVTVLPGSLVLHLRRAGDYRFQAGRSTVQSVRWGLWLAWYRPDGSTMRLRIFTPGRRREMAAALQSAGWQVQR